MGPDMPTTAPTPSETVKLRHLGRWQSVALYFATALAWLAICSRLPEAHADAWRTAGLLAIGALALSCSWRRPLPAQSVPPAAATLKLAQRLDEEAERYRVLVESSPVGILHYDKQLKITQHNSRLSKLLQVPGDALLGLEMGRLQDQRVLPALRAALAGESGRYDGAYHVTQSSRRLRVRLRTAPVYGPDRRITGGVAIVEDITAQYEAEAMLHDSEARYALAMRGTNEGLWDWSPASDDLFLSSRLVEMLGMQGEHLRTNGQDWLARLHPEDAGRFSLTLIEHLKGQTPHFECEYRVRDAAGEWRWVLARGLAQIDDNGQAYRMVGSVGDITPRKAAEAELQALNRELESRVTERTAQMTTALAELESFSYSVSHDLRAPLRAIDGYGAILSSDHSDVLGEDARHLLQRMRAAAQRMGGLIDDLLNLAHVSRQAIKREPVNISELAIEVIAELRMADPLRSLEISIQPGLTADADTGLSRILLRNLLGNAWKFTARNPAARIDVHSEGAGDGAGALRICVEDNGAGFDMRYADKLFVPFQRLHHERDFEGSGIGLATVARIVHRHGGEIGAVGEPGKGARFYFSLGPG